MKYKFIDFEMGAVIKKFGIILTAFVFVYVLGSVIENASVLML